MSRPGTLAAMRANRSYLTLVTHLVIGAVLLLGAAHITSTAMPLGTAYVPVSLAIYGVLLALLLTTAGAGAPHHFGTANRVTLLRAILVCLVGGVIVSADHTQAIAWVTVATALVAEFLDGVDGWVARRRGQSSAFGARFDVETDALFILLLTILIWRFDKAGAWILAIGLMRYAYLFAALFVTALRQPLPPSKRRQTICVVQAITLTVCLAPLVTPLLTGVIAAAALIVLTWSFAVDIAWQLRALPTLQGET
ncbi:MAG: CDP-alcohol phosphatidyltransferase family protein [Alphaproteobacteria bacterium]